MAYDRDDYISSIILFCVGSFILGAIIGVMVCSFGTTEVVSIDILNETCIELYGPEAYWIDDNIGTEFQLVCRIDSEEPQPIPEEEPWAKLV